MTKLLKRIVALGMAATVTATAVTATSFTATASETKASYDFTVWANGKDVKANAKKKVEEDLNKTATLQHKGMFTGGKWSVMVTDTTVEDADAFVKLFDEKAKLNETGKAMQKKMKSIASAKIKEGKITATAGKSAGEFLVWVYEVNSKKIVNDKEGGVQPKSYKGITKMAPSSLVVTTNADLMDKKVDKKAKFSDKSIYVGETTFYVGDSKADFDSEAEIKVEGKCDEGITVAPVASKHAFKVTATKAGKAKITVTCTESGKKVSLSLTVKEKIYTVTAKEETKGKNYQLFEDAEGKKPITAKTEFKSEDPTVYYAKVSGENTTYEKATKGTHYTVELKK